MEQTPGVQFMSRDLGSGLITPFVVNKNKKYATRIPGTAL
jgi:hypothetical protein